MFVEFVSDPAHFPSHKHQQRLEAIVGKELILFIKVSMTTGGRTDFPFSFWISNLICLWPGRGMCRTKFSCVPKAQPRGCGAKETLIMHSSSDKKRKHGWAFRQKILNKFSYLTSLRKVRIGYWSNFRATNHATAKGWHFCAFIHEKRKCLYNDLRLLSLSKWADLLYKANLSEK